MRTRFYNSHLLRILSAILLIQTVYAQNSGSDYDVVVMGTNQLTRHDVIEQHGKKLDQIFKLEKHDSTLSDKLTHELELEIGANDYFGYTSIQLFRSYSGSSSFIIDIVESGSMASRMSFSEPEGLTFEDPRQLIAQWREYLRASFLKNKPWDQLVREILSADGGFEATGIGLPALRE